MGRSMLEIWLWLPQMVEEEALQELASSSRANRVPRREFREMAVRVRLRCLRQEGRSPDSAVLAEEPASDVELAPAAGFRAKVPERVRRALARAPTPWRREGSLLTRGQVAQGVQRQASPRCQEFRFAEEAATSSPSRVSDQMGINPVILRVRLP